MAIQASFPIWQDERLLHNYDRLDYYVTFNDETIFRGRAFRSPKNVPIELDINRIVGDWLENGIDPEYEGVLKQENAWGQFKVWDQTTGYLLAEYGVMFNWEQEWSGESKVLSEPVNGKMDPRMRLFWSKYNVSETSVVVEGEDIYWFDADDAVSVAWDAGRATVGIRTNYSIREIVAVCPEGVRTLVYGTNWQFEVPVNDDPDNPKTYTVQWYRNGVLLDQTVITVAKAEYVFSCDEYLYVPVGGGRYTIHYQTNIPDAGITPVVPSGWTIVSFGGGSLVLDIPLNQTGSELVNTVSFQFNGNVVGSTSVIQAYDDYFVAQSAVTIDYPGGMFYVPVATSYALSSITVECNGIIFVAPASGIFSFYADRNSGDTQLHYTIRYYRYGQLLGTTLVTQRAMSVRVSDAVGFTATEDDTLVAFIYSMDSGGKTADYIEYSVDGINWSSVNVHSSSFGEITTIDSGETVYFRSTNKTFKQSGDDASNMRLRANKDVILSGNLFSMIYGANFSGQTVFDGDVSRMFGYLYLERSVLESWGITWKDEYALFNNSGILDSSGLVIPATKYTEFPWGNFMELFGGQSKMTRTMPELPCTDLSELCYYMMFHNCYNLENAPILPAQFLPYNAYSLMFSHCYKLDHIECYATEFQLTQESHTPPTSGWVNRVAETGTFVKTSGVTWTVGNDGIPSGWTVVEVSKPYVNFSEKATYVDPYSTGQTVTVEYDTNLNIQDVTFSGATLISKSQTGATFTVNGPTVISVIYDNSVIATYGILSMADKPFTITYLENATLIVSRETNSIDGFVRVRKEGDTDWIVPNTTGGTAPTIYAYAGESYEFESNMFTGNRFKACGTYGKACKISGNIASLFNYRSINTQYSGLFDGWNIHSIDGLAIPPEYWYGSGLFSGITSIEEAKVYFDPSERYYLANMFAGCTALTIADMTLVPQDSSVFYEMFSGCTSLVTPPRLPATTLFGGAYNGMFKNCTSLVNAPELPASAVLQNSYREMFNGCSSLAYVKCLATSTYDWTSLFSWLGNVSANGTFVRKAGSSAIWASGGSGIPEGWTIEEI